MELKEVIEQLREKFSAPLPECYKRRIIFWKDEKREFEDQIESISLDNVKIISLTGSNYFEIKKRLLSDDTTSNYLIYDPLCVEKEDNWLLDIEKYSEKFHADLTALWISEMGLPQMQEMYVQVSRYQKFFKSSARRLKLPMLSGAIDTPDKLHFAVMAIVCGLDKIDPASILQTVMSNGLDNDSNKIYSELKKYDLDSTFWDLTYQLTGYSEAEESTIEKLAAHILLTASSMTLTPQILKKMDYSDKESQKRYCYNFISKWIDSKNQKDIKKIAQHIEETLQISEIFEDAEVEDLQETECFPCIHECLLSKLMTEVNDDLIDLNRINGILDKRRTMAWYSDYENCYEGVLQIAKMHEFKKKHEGFNTVDPVTIWNNYAESYYLMDKYYRLFHVYFSRSLKSENSEILDELFKQLADKAEGLYGNWFLGQLGEIWSKACEDQMKTYGRLTDIPYQENFYKERVEGKNHRVFVIISDALRYGTAKDLEEVLSKRQSEVKMYNCQAVFPTITKFGMAALLPHKELNIKLDNNNNLYVLVDNESADGITNRENILKKADPESVALKYDEIITMKKADRIEKVRDKNVVYIYHDKIDSISHSNGAVFEACDEAIKEIENLVRIITNELGGTRILITADHGFIYTHKPLDESNKVSKAFFGSECIECGRRHAILKNDAKPENLMEVKFLDGKTEYRAFAPRENIRIKIQGSDGNFVHGGTSLQEMMIPIIEYRHLRNNSADVKKNPGKYKQEYVSIGLLDNANKKIANMVFTLKFYQKEAVKDNWIEAKYNLFIVDERDEKVSDEQKIIADKTSENNKERIISVKFTLDTRKYMPTETYYLVIQNEKSKEVEREEFQIDIPFNIGDFKF